MDATQLPNQEDETTYLNEVVTFIGIGAAILLFLFVLGRLGVFNRILPAEAAAPSAEWILTTQDMAFGQTELQAQAGQPLTIQLDNKDLYAHSFDLDALNIHIPMSANSTGTAAVTFAEAGTYTFYCGVPGHEEAGMVGTIIVK